MTSDNPDAPLIEAMARASEEVARLAVEKVTGGKVLPPYDWEIYIPMMAAALAAIRAAGWHVARWGPIETAPRDGTKVHLLFPYPHGIISNCWWNTKKSRWVLSKPRYTAGILHVEDKWEILCTTIEPTHWMPLSQPPKP